MNCALAHHPFYRTDQDYARRMPLHTENETTIATIKLYLLKYVIMSKLTIQLHGNQVPRGIVFCTSLFLPMKASRKQTPFAFCVQ